MKKLLLVFVLCALSLYSILFCYADVNSNAMNIMEDLPWINKFEPKDNLKYINEYNISLQSIISEQNRNLNTLNNIYYFGNNKESFDGNSLRKCLDWEGSFKEGAPLFKSDIYKGYYSLRTRNILKQYQTSKFFNYAAFVKTGRVEFDSYIKGIVKDQSHMGQLTVLLQEKVFDKLLELEPLKRKGLLDEVLDIGLPANNSKSLDCLYQMFESRVRLQLFDQMADLSKQKLQSISHKIGIVITGEKSGELQLQSKDISNKDHVVNIINVLQEEDSYRGLTLLSELYNKNGYKLIFKEKDGDSQEMELEKAINAIALDEDGYMHLDIDSLFSEEVKARDGTVAINPAVSTIGDAQLKQVELLYAAKSKAAAEIIKELNRYSIYLELKDKKANNLYTKSFEAGQKIWKKNLDNKLNNFGIGGSADFLAYIKQFELLDSNPNKSEKARLLITKFRNSDIQFRTTEEGSIWLVNVLSKFRLVK